MINTVISNSKELTKLVEEVEILYGHKAKFTIDDNMKSQGGFAYQDVVPSFFLEVIL